MRIANVRGRLTLLETGSEIDVEQTSKGKFGSDPHAVFEQWAAFKAWAPTVTLVTPVSPTSCPFLSTCAVVSTAWTT